MISDISLSAVNVTEKSLLHHLSQYSVDRTSYYTCMTASYVSHPVIVPWRPIPHNKS